MIPAIVCASVAGLLFAYGYTLDHEYRRGFADGFEKGKAEGLDEGRRAGKIEADCWWFGAESDVERAQVRLADQRAEQSRSSEERWP